MLIDAQTIRQCVTMRGLVDALSRPPPTIAPARQQHHLGSAGTLLLMPAWDEAAFGVKLVTVFPANAESALPTVIGQYFLGSVTTGEALAVIDGTELTLWRTAAISALAASRLASPRAKQILVIGTGALAPYLIKAHRALRPDARCTIWGRNPSKAAALAAAVQREAARAVEAAPDLESAARSADIICCATSSSEPMLRGAWLKTSVHVDLIGGFTPRMREADDDVVRGAALFVDTPAAATESGDLIVPIANGIVDPARIGTITELLNSPRDCARTSKTVVKSIGSAANDLAAARYVLRCAQASSSRSALGGRQRQPIGSADLC